MISNPEIDGGRGFDWGKTSPDYARYRDIYPPEFYQKIMALGVCLPGQKVLDLGTGTGVLPRNLYRYGAGFTGVDCVPEQIDEARRLARSTEMEIEFLCRPAEALDFEENTFDAVTACQCFFYFDHGVLAPELSRLLKPGGRLAVMYMAWLPFEDHIARASEGLILNYNPAWSGGGERRRPIDIPACYGPYFKLERRALFDLRIPFTRESWNGRIRACRGVGASLPAEKIAAFEAAHMALLEARAPERFEILHYAAMAVLSVKK